MVMDFITTNYRKGSDKFMDMYQKRKMRAENKKSNNQESFTSVGINWYPGHMAKTKKLIKDNLNLIDIIYEVIDSRIPYSSKIQDINSIINNKPRILIMTKYDLCDKNETEKFVKHYEKMGYKVLKFDLIKDKNADYLLELSNKMLEDKIKKQQEKGITKNTIRALVVGIPNVGKSTLINKIVGKKSSVVGNKPGVTKNLNWIRVRKNIELLDSPGILWPKLEQETVAFNLASTTAIKEEILVKEDIAIYIIKTLYKYYPDILKEKYNVSNIDDFEEVFDTIGKKCGCLKKGGVVDYDKVIDLIINDVKSGKIKNITFDRLENE